MACPFHHRRWRGEIQGLLNQLRGKLLQNKHIRNFSRPICTCKGKKGPVSAVIEECSVEELNKWLEPEGPVQSNFQLKEMYLTLRYFLNSAEKTSLDDDIRKGLLRILTVIKAASSGDFSSLESQTKKATEPVILKTEMELPLSSSHLGVFFGFGGKHIKPLCSKQGVTVHFDSKEQRHHRRLVYGGKYHITGDSVKVSMTYLPERQEKVEAIRSMLQKRTELVTEQRTQHEANVRAWSELRVKRQALRRQQVLSKQYENTINQTPKEAATAKFERKIQHTKQRTSSTGSDQDPIDATGEQKGKNQQQKQQHSKSKILSDGHCLNCMAEFRPQETNEGACTFHSGYLVPVKPGKENKGYSWSCCKKRTAAQHPTHELHARTGCTSGHHTWRPGKQSNKGHKGGAANKGKGLAADSSDFYVN